MFLALLSVKLDVLDVDRSQQQAKIKSEHDKEAKPSKI